MGRYPSRAYKTKRSRSIRKLYVTGSLVIIIAVVLVYIYYPSGEREDQVPEIPASVDIVIDANEVVTKEPISEPEPEVIPEPCLPEIKTTSVDEPNSEAAKIIDEAMTLINSQPADIIAARDRLNELLPMPMNAQQRAFVKKQLSDLADKWLFNKTVFPNETLCSLYKVRPGQLLSSIGKEYKVPWEILQQINNISRPEALQAGQTIKVINGPFHTRVHRSTFTMDLYLNDTFVRSFPVGLGKPGYETPTGLWLVKRGGKLISPTWTNPDSGKTYEAEDPNYPLGSRWIGLKGVSGPAKDRTGFAIHGTKDPLEIGVAKSRGCIRLHNGDAVLIYNLMVSGFSQVEVVE